MCECYKIGGPWIAEDPDCPVHGYEARIRDREREQDDDRMNARILELERQVSELTKALGQSNVASVRLGPGPATKSYVDHVVSSMTNDFSGWE